MRYLVIFGLAALWAGCGSDAGATSSDGVTVVVGADGGMVSGGADTPLAGVEIEVPSGALSGVTTITLGPGEEQAPLPAGAYAVGAQIRLEPDGLLLDAPVRVTLPVDASSVSGYGQDHTMVKVWLRGPHDWLKLDAVDSAPGWVTVEIERFGAMAPGVKVEE